MRSVYSDATSRAYTPDVAEEITRAFGAPSALGVEHSPAEVLNKCGPNGNPKLDKEDGLVLMGPEDQSGNVRPVAIEFLA